MKLIRDAQGHYRTKRGTAASQDEILEAAEQILRARFERIGTLSSPSDVRAFLRMRLAGLDHEEFHVVWLDHRHQVLAVDRLFSGTIDGAAVYPREVIRAALAHNASCAIVAHNHPSGIVEASVSDRTITETLRAALLAIDVRLLDHFIVGSGQPLSFAERGWL